MYLNVRGVRARAWPSVTLSSAQHARAWCFSPQPTRVLFALPSPRGACVQSSSPLERDVLLRALSCAVDPGLQVDYLQMLATPAVRLQVGTSRCRSCAAGWSCSAHCGSLRTPLHGFARAARDGRAGRGRRTAQPRRARRQGLFTGLGHDVLVRGRRLARGRIAQLLWRVCPCKQQAVLEGADAPQVVRRHCLPLARPRLGHLLPRPLGQAAGGPLHRHEPRR